MRFTAGKLSWKQLYQLTWHAVAGPADAGLIALLARDAARAAVGGQEGSTATDQTGLCVRPQKQLGLVQCISPALHMQKCMASHLPHQLLLSVRKLTQVPGGHKPPAGQHERPAAAQQFARTRLDQGVSRSKPYNLHSKATAVYAAAFRRAS